MKKLFVVLVSYLEKEKMEKCLESMKGVRMPKGWGKETIIVDNNDYKFEFQLKDITILRNESNYGFAKAVNLGIKQAIKHEAEAVLLLNPDTVVKKDFLFHLLNNQADIVGPVIKFKRKGKIYYDFGGKVNFKTGKTYHIEKKDLRFKIYDLDYVSGCAMLIKKVVWEKIGLLDERYFLYFEDVDCCLRAKKAGFKIAVEPKAEIFHDLKDPQVRSFGQNLRLSQSHFRFIHKWIRRPNKLLAYGNWLISSLKILI